MSPSINILNEQNSNHTHTNSTPSQPSKPFDVAVIGGGIAGVVQVLCMKQEAPHIPVTLYESASKFGEIGAGLAFGPNAARAVRGISPEVAKAYNSCISSDEKGEGPVNYWFNFRCGMNGKDGSPIKDGKWITRSLTGAEPGAHVHRAHFLDAVVGLLPEGVSKFNKRVKNIEEKEDGVHILFTDGTTAVHGAVIGCDGIRSRTRSMVLGEKNPATTPVYSGEYCYRGLIPMTDAVAHLGEELATNRQIFVGPGGHVLAFPIRDGTILNVVLFIARPEWHHEKWVIDTNKDFLRKDFEGWGETVQKIIDLMDPNRLDIWALFHHETHADTYYKGNVCLSGDAAHASTPHQGAGAGQAIEDAYVMGRLLKHVQSSDDFVHAFKSYDAVRRARSQRLVSTSQDCGKLYDFELPGYGEDLELFAENVNTRMRWIWDHNLDEDVYYAKEMFLGHQATAKGVVKDSRK